MWSSFVYIRYILWLEVRFHVSIAQIEACGLDCQNIALFDSQSFQMPISSPARKSSAMASGQLWAVFQQLWEGCGELLLTTRSLWQVWHSNNFVSSQTNHHHDHVHISGGSDINLEHKHDIWKFDAKTGEWILVAYMREGRNFHGVSVVKYNDYCGYTNT